MSQQLFSELEKLLAEVEQTVIDTPESLETFRIRFLGSKNILKHYFGEIKQVEPALKKSYGQQVNAIKQAAEEKFTNAKGAGSATKTAIKKNKIDVTLPGEPFAAGGRHPVSILMQRIVNIFRQIGFTIEEDREIEDEWHNFTALNIPEDHPSRDMTDTYYLKFDAGRVLRSQTSNVQIRVMENRQPPIRIISPGRVYRNETVSARSHCQFHQIEGLYVNEGVSFAELKQTLLYFVRQMFGPKTEIRLRSSYFPFTEPSAELDVSCFLCDAKGCNVCKHTGWVEILGCGMIDPQVLEHCGIDSERYTGFAFGMGIERPALLAYKIPDIRLFFENDVRFLKQFKSAV